MLRGPRHGHCRATPRIPAATFIGLCAAWAGGAGSLGAQPLQSSVLPAATPTTSLVGIVGDSLHGGPLAGAVVVLDGQPREAVTDSIGRFRIDSVATGRYRVGIFHPILDSMGTSLASRPVRFTAGKPLLISLATPSGRTIRRAICSELPRVTSHVEHGDSGVAVLVGRVLDPESDAPVAGATVTLAWVETILSRQAIRATSHQRSTTTDDMGDFRFCALPSGLNGVLRAVGPNGADAVERELGLENRIVTMATVHVPIPDSTTAGKPSRHAVLTGAVERPDGSPMIGATALIRGTTDSAKTGHDGTFSMKGLPAGTHMLVVRSVGFEPVAEVVELANLTPQRVAISMSTPAQMLSPVIVEAQRLQAGYVRVGFARRRESGAGQFLTADDIAEKHAQTFSQLFAATAGVQRSYTPGGSNLGSGHGIGSCLVYVLDGHPFNRIVDGELDTMFRPDEIAGVEIYSPAAVPPEFRTRTLPGPNAAGVPTDGTDGCTTIVVWTKAALAVEMDR
jgi:hypothetical protein